MFILFQKLGFIMRQDRIREIKSVNIDTIVNEYYIIVKFNDGSYILSSARFNTFEQAQSVLREFFYIIYQIQYYYEIVK
jgi:hypothetical protein